MSTPDQYLNQCANAVPTAASVRVILVMVNEMADVTTDGPPTQFVAGFIDGIAGDRISVRTPTGMHWFTRASGAWSEGPCLNYKDAVILDYGTVEESIRQGFGGDIGPLFANQKSRPPSMPAQAANPSIRGLR